MRLGCKKERSPGNQYEGVEDEMRKRRRGCGGRGGSLRDRLWQKWQRDGRRGSRRRGGEREGREARSAAWRRLATPGDAPPRPRGLDATRGRGLGRRAQGRSGCPGREWALGASEAAEPSRVVPTSRRPDSRPRVSDRGRSLRPRGGIFRDLAVSAVGRRLFISTRKDSPQEVLGATLATRNLSKPL